MIRKTIMTSIEPFEASDLLKLNEINLDIFTENFPIEFYFEYLILWPSLFFKSTELSTKISGYMMGKTEGKGNEWHSHITAVTISPNFRRVSLASQLCQVLETITDSKQHEVNFIDLFVKCNNDLAIKLYEKLGYSVYRRVVGYYNSVKDGYPKSCNKLNDDKDAYDMRKSMKRDMNRSIRNDGKFHRCYPHDVKFQ